MTTMIERKFKVKYKIYDVLKISRIYQIFVLKSISIFRLQTTARRNLRIWFKFPLKSSTSTTTVQNSLQTVMKLQHRKI